MNSYILSRYCNWNIIIVWIKVRHNTISQIVFLTIEIKIRLAVDDISILILSNRLFIKHLFGEFQNGRSTITYLLQLLPSTVSGFL